jgi:hypothetical protein
VKELIFKASSAAKLFKLLIHSALSIVSNSASVKHRNLSIDDMEVPTLSSLLTGVAVALIVYAIGKGFYNIYWHPLSKFPGPKITAAGPLYEFYHDVIKDGTYVSPVSSYRSIEAKNF